MTPAQLARGWVMANPVTTAPITGLSRPSQFDETLAARPIELTDTERAVVDAAWATVQPSLR